MSGCIAVWLALILVILGSNEPSSAQSSTGGAQSRSSAPNAGDNVFDCVIEMFKAANKDTSAVNTLIYYLRKGVFEFYFIEEGGKLKVLTLGFEL